MFPNYRTSLDKPRGLQNLGLSFTCELGSWKHSLVGAKELLHGMGTEHCSQFLLISEEELVPIRATEDNCVLSKNLGLEDVRGILLHPIANELLWIPIQEFKSFTQDRPTQAPRWQPGGVTVTSPTFQSQDGASNGDK